MTLLDALLDYSPVVRRVVRWVGLHSSYDSVNSPNLQSLLLCSSLESRGPFFFRREP